MCLENPGGGPAALRSSRIAAGTPRGPGVGARVAARGRRPEPAPWEATTMSQGVAAPIGPTPGGRTACDAGSGTPPQGREARPASASAQGSPVAAPAAPTSYPRARVRRSPGSEVLQMHAWRGRPYCRVLSSLLCIFVTRGLIIENFTVYFKSSL